jgi:hypothetical protein
VVGTVDIDIWRAADLLIKRHGEDAAIHAAQRADELPAEGDIEGQIVFKRIVEAINELQRQKREPGEAVN